MTNRLQWEVFVSGQIPVVTNDLPPGQSEMRWSPISSTLISGERDAVLVEAFRNGEDIHTRTAAEVMGIPPLMVGPEDRRRAKAAEYDRQQLIVAAVTEGRPARVGRPFFLPGGS